MNKKGYIVPHTHWDREWRYPLWQSTVNFAEMMDELIEILESQPEYKSFLMDGQYSLLEDYLFIRPEKEDRLKKLVRDRRILIGPWYTLPDLYPVSGESIVRNLLKGRQKCIDFGAKPLEVGYESFGWGQPSQFPQIYRGFGIDTVVVAKRVDNSRAPESEFMWVGKDGSKVLATRLGIEARANFFMHTYLQAMTGQEYKSDEFRFESDKGEIVYHPITTPSHEHDHFKLKHKQHIHTDELRELALRSWHAMDDSLMETDRILMNGSDSTTAQPQLLELVELVNKALKEDGIHLEMGSLEEYMQLLKDKLPQEKLREIHGELRDGPPFAVTGNALMTRPRIKTKNRAAQYALFDTAEPLAVATALTGGSYERIYLDRALTYLLLAHSHDCINGVTQDKTADDVMYRLAQVQEIAQVVQQNSIRHFIKQLNHSKLDPAETLLMVVNPLPFSRNEVVEAYIDLPREQDVWDFEIIDMQGHSVPVQRIARDEDTIPVVSLYSRPQPFYIDRHKIHFETGELPAGGYKTYKVVPKSRFSRKIEAWAPNRITHGKEIAQSVTAMSNEHIAVDVLGDGSVQIQDKNSGKEYGPLNYFEDMGDTGDYWVYYPPYHNKTYTTKGGQAELWLEDNTELSATICAAVQLAVPAFCNRAKNYVRGKSNRSQQKTTLEFMVRYTLHKDENFLRVHTTLDNTAHDHRVSACFDTGILAEQASVQGHFCVDQRNAVPVQEKDGSYYNEMSTQPMQDFIRISQEEDHFSLLTNSLGEYDISSPGRLTCTLLRAMKNRICTEFRSFSEYTLQNGGQSPGIIQHEYALAPCKLSDSQLYQAAQQLNVPPLSVQFTSDGESAGSLPEDRASFYAVEGAVLSALKIAEHSENYIMRLYNPQDVPSTATVRLMVAIKEAYQTDMAEQRTKEIKHTGDSLLVELAANEVVTIEIVVEQ